MAVCITIGNETWKEFVNTVKGVLTNYDLINKKKDIKNRFLVFVIANDYKKLDKSFKIEAEAAGIYNSEKLKEF